MKSLTKISALILSAALIIGASSVSTYAQESDGATPACKHTYVSVVSREATPAKLSYKYKYKCTKCNAIEKDSNGKSKVYEGKAKLKSTPVKEGVLKFKVKITAEFKSMNQLACSIKVLGSKPIKAKRYSIVQDAKGDYYGIQAGFNKLWHNPKFGVKINKEKGVLTWSSVSEVDSKNQKKLTGFVNTKYSGYTNGTSLIRKLSVVYPTKTKNVK